MKDIHHSELRTLIAHFEPADLAMVLHFIAERIAAAPVVDDLDSLPVTKREKPQRVPDRMELQALVHQAYQEAGFVVVDVPDGSVGIVNASWQIVSVTNRILELLVDRLSPKAQR